MINKNMMIIFTVMAVMLGFIACEINNKKDDKSLISALAGMIIGPASSVIDGSQDCTGGYTFGKKTDEAKRFQTFIADANSNITAIEVKIRKNNTTDTYNNVTVELYSTDSSNLPTGTSLADAVITTSSLGTDFTVMRASLKYKGLVSGNSYAIVLGQEDATVIDNAGYEWCTAEINSDWHFGKTENGTTWTLEDFGDGWLKVYVTSSAPLHSSCDPLDTFGQVSVDGGPLKYSVESSQTGTAKAVSIYASGATMVTMCFDSLCAEQIVVTFPGKTTGTFSNLEVTTKKFISYKNNSEPFNGFSDPSVSVSGGIIHITKYDDCYVSGTFSSEVADSPDANPLRKYHNLTNGSFKAYRQN